MTTNLFIKDIAYTLPQKIQANADLLAENPTWDIERVQGKSGVLARHIAEKDETALDLALDACNKLISRHPSFLSEIDALVCCTQSPDYIMPPNSCILHKLLHLRENVLAFDFNLACSGYVYGLAILQGLLRARLATNFLFITGDTYSKLIHPQDRSARVLFGDGAAVTWLTSDPSFGLKDVLCATSGENFDKFIIPAGGARNPKTEKTSIANMDNNGNIRTDEHIHMDGMAIMEFVLSKIPSQIKALLSKNNLSVNDVDWFVFHQASKLVIDSLTKILRIPAEKVFLNLMSIGNTVSASIPVALADLCSNGNLKRGNKIVISGFGVGLSYATALIEY